MLDRLTPQTGSVARASRAYPAASYGTYDLQAAYGIEPSADDRLDLRSLFGYLIHYRVLIGAFLLAGLAIGLLAFFVQTPIYRATARIEISTSPARVVRDLEMVSETADLRTFQTAIERLKSRAVIRRTVDALDLSRDPDFLRPGSRFSLRHIANRILGRSAGSLPRDQAGREQAAISRIEANLAVSLIRNTSILSLAYRDPSPDRARLIVNQLADSFIDQRAEQTSQTAALARRFIQHQVVEVKGRLQQSEAALVAYAKAQGLTATGTDGSLIEQNLRAINATLAETMGQRLAAESLVQQIDKGEGEKLEEVLENSAGLEIRGRIVELRAEYQQKLRLFKPDFPDMRMLAAQVGEYERQLGDLNAAVLSSVRQRHAEALGREAELEGKLAELEADQAAYADKNIHYTILKREVDSQRAQYEALVAKLNEVDVGAELKSQSASVLDYALAPSNPLSPQLSRMLAVAVVLAAGLAALAIYLAEILNNVFRTPEQVEAHLQVSVLSALPLALEDRFEAELSDLRSPLSEAYRSLRTSLQMAGNGARILLVTSAQPGEGKTTTACKIAQDYAALGLQVLLVDADMRRPAIHRRLKIANRSGLSNVLARKVTREAFRGLFRIVAPNLTVLAAGPIAANPVDLLSSHRTPILFDALQKRFDLVVVDAPPMLGLSDAPILSRLADATLLVVSAGQVSRRTALLSLNRLRAAGANIVGVALTKWRPQAFESAYAYGYATGAAEGRGRPVKGRRSPISWDYFGDVHVAKPGLLGLFGAAGAGLRAWLLGRRKPFRRFGF